MTRFLKTYLPNPQQHPIWLVGFLWTVILSLWLGAATEKLWLSIIPMLVLGASLVVVDVRLLFFGVFAVLPVSMEIILPNGLGTDLPIEPLLIVLTGAAFLLFLVRGRTYNLKPLFQQPLTQLLLLHLLWTFVAVILSDDRIISLKFFLAKLWYVVPFYFLGYYFIRSPKDIYRIIWLVGIPLSMTVLWVLYQHAQFNFSFDKANYACYPFFRNHVNYACILALFLPFLWFARRHYPSYSNRWWLLVIITIIMLLGIQFSYTRAAYVSLMGAVAAYFMIKYRFTKAALIISVAVAILGVGWLMSSNNYLRFAPDFEKTVTQTSFENLVEATAKGQDLSTMERVYRWVAGAHMIEQRPYFGFGPGNFYSFYKHYTINKFETYVSDNPEKSGIHCYYLMVWVEQGFIGMLIFVALVFCVLLYGERLYHHTKNNDVRRIILMAVLSSIIIDLLLLMNDMVESHKVGSFFFFNMAILVAMQRYSKKLD